MSPEPTDLEAELIALVRSSAMLMRAARAARNADPPQWVIGAGAIRDCVWAHLHGFSPPAPRDVDLAFYDRNELGPEREGEVLREVREQAPDLPWEVTNEARAHLWYPHVHGVAIRPFLSTADAVASWPETATAVAIRLTADDRIRVVAPWGLADLFGIIWRHNPRIAPVAVFNERLRSKRIVQRWPRVRIIAPSQRPRREA
jgi:hypothetical protein